MKRYSVVPHGAGAAHMPSQFTNISKCAVAIYHNMLRAGANSVQIYDNRMGVFIEPKTVVKVSLRRVRINSQGYDDKGHYWGVGQPLFYREWDEAEGPYTSGGYMRADDRDHAKGIIRAELNECLVKFYR
jgi:hypothetical protein